MWSYYSENSVEFNPLTPEQTGFISAINMGRRQWETKEEMPPKICKRLVKRENSKLEKSGKVPKNQNKFAL